MFLAILRGSIWIPLAALTGIVSILHLGGMFCAKLTQLSLLLVGTFSQFLARNRIIKGTFCTLRILITVRLIFILGRVCGSLLADCMLEILLLLILGLDQCELGLKLVNLHRKMRHFP